MKLFPMETLDKITPSEMGLASLDLEAVLANFVSCLPAPPHSLFHPLAAP